MRYEIERRDLGGGWLEVRIVSFVPGGFDMPNHRFFDMLARKHIAKFMLAGSAGIATRLAMPTLADLIQKMWFAIEGTFKPEEAQS